LSRNIVFPRRLYGVSGRSQGLGLVDAIELKTLAA